jgi:hypothetical protein
VKLVDVDLARRNPVFFEKKRVIAINGDESPRIYLGTLQKCNQLSISPVEY